MKPATGLALVCLLIGLSPLVQARSAEAQATVYRCGPEGRDLRDNPCPDGKADTTHIVRYNQPSAEQRKAAREQVRDDARLAEDLRKERLAHEALQRRLHAKAASIGPSAAPKAPPKAAETKSPTPHAKRHARLHTGREPADPQSTSRTARAPQAATQQARP